MEPACEIGNLAESFGAQFSISAAVDLSMKDFLAELDCPSPSPPPASGLNPVYYLQSQNGNLGGEFEALRDDVGEQGPSFAREVFGG